MKQPLLAIQDVNLSTGSTRYHSLIGVPTGNSNEDKVCGVISTPGKISKLKVELFVAPGAGKSWTFTLRVNQANSSLTCTIADTDTSGEDAAHEVTVSRGDLVSLTSTPSATPASTYARWSTIFESDNPKESISLSGGAGIASGTKYAPLVEQGYLTAEIDAQYCCPIAGKFRNLHAWLSAVPGAGDSFVFTLRVNGANSALTFTIAGTDHEGSDLAHDVSVSAGDLVDIKVTPGGSPSNPWAAYGITFEASVDGESVILGGCKDILHNANTEYIKLLGGRATSWQPNGVEWPKASSLGQECVLKNLRVKLTVAPGAGKSRTFVVWRNGANTALTCTISDTDTEGSDDVNEISISDWDDICLKTVPAGAPVNARAFWGAVQLIAEAVGGGGASGLAQAGGAMALLT